MLPIWVARMIHNHVMHPHHTLMPSCRLYASNMSTKHFVRHGACLSFMFALFFMHKAYRDATHRGLNLQFLLQSFFPCTFSKIVDVYQFPCATRSSEWVEFFHLVIKVLDLCWKFAKQTKTCQWVDFPCFLRRRSWLLLGIFESN